MKRAALLLACAAVLAGCATPPRVVAVKVPVPVACQEAVPERPAMPVEALRGQRASLYETVQAARGEIEVREAYEGRLRTALNGCISPVALPPAAGASPLGLRPP